MKAPLRILNFFTLCAAAFPHLLAQSTREELLCALKSAAKSHDNFAMEECFHFEGTDPDQ